MKESGYTEKSAVDELLEDHGKTYITSRFHFLMAHNGLRPSECHGFLGRSGGGKSTLMRTLTIDIFERKDPTEKVLLWLSEETIKEFRTQLVRSSYNPLELKMLTIMSEQDIIRLSDKQNAISGMLEMFLVQIASNEYRYVILDNITTSIFYMGKTPTQQDMVALKIKTAIARSGASLICYFHTKAEISEYHRTFINSNDVRGSKGPIMLFQFIYILQQFIYKEAVMSTIRVAKHRTQDVKEKIFRLIYSSHHAIYVEDRIMDLDQMKEALEKAFK